MHENHMRGVEVAESRSVRRGPLRFTYTRTEADQALPYPLLDKARANWAGAQARLDAVAADGTERTVLAPALRRKAVLDAALETTEFTGWIWVPLLPLLLGLPAALVHLTGGRMGGTHLTVVYLLYLPCLPLAVLMLVFVWMVLPVLLAAPFDRSEEIPEWAGYPVVLIQVGGATAGLALWFDHLRHSDATFLLSLFAAVAFLVLAALVIAAAIPRANARQRKQRGVQGLDHLAALALFDTWEALERHRRGWRTPRVRRELQAQVLTIAAKAPAKLDQSVRAHAGTAEARQWTRTLAWHLSEEIRDHGHRLLRIDSQDQYDALVATVRRQAVETARGNWVRRAGEPKPHVTLVRRLNRLVVPLILTGAAIGVGYLPGVEIAPDNLFTVRLSLIIPAVLSVLPLGRDGQDAVSAAMNNALGRMRS